MTLWMLGFPDQALLSINEGIELATHLKHQPSLMIAIAFACFVHEARGEAHQTESYAARLAEIGMHTRWSAVANIMAASTRALATQDRNAANKMRSGIDHLRAAGTRLRMPYYLWLLADAHRRFGDASDGLAAVEEAFTQMSQTGERRWELELHRQRGELLLSSDLPDTVAAETALETALHVARQQQAKSLELRTSMSLGRLYQSKGDPARARDLLLPIQSWFSEGFDTADLKEAAALIKALEPA